MSPFAYTPPVSGEVLPLPISRMRSTLKVLFSCRSRHSACRPRKEWPLNSISPMDRGLIDRRDFSSLAFR